MCLCTVLLAALILSNLSRFRSNTTLPQDESSKYDITESQYTAVINLKKELDKFDKEEAPADATLYDRMVLLAYRLEQLDISECPPDVCDSMQESISEVKEYKKKPLTWVLLKPKAFDKCEYLVKRYIELGEAEYGKKIKKIERGYWRISSESLH
jgi:hypothetical protein